MDTWVRQVIGKGSFITAVTNLVKAFFDDRVETAKAQAFPQDVVRNLSSNTKQ